MAGILSKRLKVPPPEIKKIISFTDKYISPMILPTEKSLDISKRLANYSIPCLMKTAASHGLVSLSANQIGLINSFFVIHKNPEEGLWTGYNANEQDYEVFINPVVIQRNEKLEEKWETCPSLPTMKALCQRNTEIVLKFKDLNGETQEVPQSGFKARVVQHELNHLQGILNIMTPVSKAIIETTDENLQKDFSEFKGEIAKRIKFIRDLIDNNPRFRKGSFKFSTDKIIAAEKIAMSRQLNAYYMCRFNKTLSGSDLDLPEFNDDEYKNLLKNLTR